ncbi:hypothetical protein ACWD26_30700 [Streptomyces sp. NPDC002787]
MTLGIALGLVAAGLSAMPAAADDVDAVYLGTRKGTVGVGALPTKWRYSDRQYRSLMMANTRNHYFRVTYKGCMEWRVRIAVAHPRGGYMDDETTVEGCNQTAVVSIIGKRNANVTLGITISMSGDTSSISVKPIK